MVKLLEVYVTQISLLELAIEVIKQVKKPLTPVEIWEEAKKLKLDTQVEIKSGIPWKTINAKIYFDINNSINPLFCLYDSNPSRYYLNSLPPFQNGSEGVNTDTTPDSEKDFLYREIDLHPILVSYVFADPNFLCFAKTINSSSSTKEAKGSNFWAHPDIVGIRFPFHKDLRPETCNLMQAFETTLASFYSFELKRGTTKSNIRAQFFQAVSNSSWANEGYLVTHEMDKDDEDLIQEIRRLSNSFGIGVIQLNPKSVPDCTVISPSIRKNNLDWITINRLGIINRDFKMLMEHVTMCIKEQLPKPDIFDMVMDDEILKEHCRSKKIIIYSQEPN